MRYTGTERYIVVSLSFCQTNEESNQSHHGPTVRRVFNERQKPIAQSWSRFYGDTRRNRLIGIPYMDLGR
jgi:hypothetical protein